MALFVKSEAGLFKCHDGSQLIPFTSVNDDYCDCSDGSDEPGTSACSRGQFYCHNIGYQPKFIKSTMVNDGKCGRILV